MLTWLRGGQQTQAQSNGTIINEDESVVIPPTPGPTAFAFEALRYGIMGTPRPTTKIETISENPIPTIIEPENEQEQETDDELNITNKPSQRTERLLTYDMGTPLRKTAPQGILLTPGTALARKKTVSFGTLEEKSESTGRVRSGLPHTYPGKFPSPWTPKVASPTKKRIANASPSVTHKNISIYEDPVKTEFNSTTLTRNVKPLKSSTEQAANGLCSSVDAQIDAVKSNTALLSDLIINGEMTDAQDPDVTINLNDPKSRSGKHWKRKYNSTISNAEKQIEFYKQRKDTSVEFASKKDAQCSDLAVRLHEEIELRKKLQLEADKWHKYAMESKSDSNKDWTIFGGDHDRLNQEMADQRELLRKRERELRDLKRVHERQTEEAKKSKVEREQLEFTLAETESQLLELRQELEELAQHEPSEKEYLSRRTMEYSTETKSLKAELHQAQRDLDRLTIERDHALAESRRLRALSDTQINSLPSQAEGKSDSYKGELEDLREDMDRIVRDAEEKARANKQLAEKLSEDLYSVKEERERQRMEIESLKRELIHKNTTSLQREIGDVQATAFHADKWNKQHSSAELNEPTKQEKPITRNKSTKLSLPLVKSKTKDTPRRPSMADWGIEDDDENDLPFESPDPSDDSACDNSYDRLTPRRKSRRDEDEYCQTFEDIATTPPLNCPASLVDQNKTSTITVTTTSSKLTHSSPVTFSAPPPAAVRPSSPLKNEYKRPSIFDDSPRPKMVLIDITPSVNVSNNNNKDKSSGSPINDHKTDDIRTRSKFSNAAATGANTNTNIEDLAEQVKASVKETVMKKSVLDDPARRAAAAARVAERKARMKAEMMK